MSTRYYCWPHDRLNCRIGNCRRIIDRASVRRAVQDEGSITPDEVAEIRTDVSWSRSQYVFDPNECGS